MNWKIAKMKRRRLKGIMCCVTYLGMKNIGGSLQYQKK